MADLVQTAANVRPPMLDSKVKLGTAGENITAGEPVYLKAADKKIWRADANDSAQAEVKGIAVTNGTTNGGVLYATGNDLNIGATLTVGETYILSANVGKIAPIGDAAAGMYITHLGVGMSTSLLRLNVYNSGILR